MVASPWANKKLSRGQVEQRLRSLGCSFVLEQKSGSASWVAPNGRHFTIRYDEVDGAFLERMVAKIEQWIEKSNP